MPPGPPSAAPLGRRALNHHVGPLRLHPVTIAGDGSVIVDTSEILVRKNHNPEHIVPGACGARFCAADVERV